MSRNSQHPPCHPPQLLVFRIDGFDCSIPLVASPLVEPAGQRSLEADAIGFQRGVPGDLPLAPQPAFQAYLILNACRYRWSWVVTRATLGSLCCQSLQNGDGEVSTHVSIAISLCNSGSKGISSSKLVWKLAQSVRLK